MDYSIATIDEDNQKYQIEITFPVFSGDQEEVLKKINGTIRSALDNSVYQFKSEYGSMNHEYDPGPWFLSYDAEVTRNDAAFLSLVLRGSIYTGGAHPNQIYETFVFNFEEESSLMNLEDVFNPLAAIRDPDTGAELDWLDFVSAKIQLALLDQEYSDADWIREGAGAKVSNYELFYLTDTGITFIFPPYQVAPYAAGPQEVGFKYEELAGYLKAYDF